MIFLSEPPLSSHFLLCFRGSFFGFRDQLPRDQTSRDQMRIEIKCLVIKQEWKSNIRRSNGNGDQTSGDQMRMEIKCPEIRQEWRSNVRRSDGNGDQMRMEIKC